MKINAIEVEGFGAWSNLRLAELSEGLNVFCGPNEAGKTTLLQFVRSVFYGFSDDRRRYLPPVHGGRPGGVIDVSGPSGRFRVARHDEDAGATPARAVLLASDGSRQGEHFLKVLLCNVDESIFNNVFAVGLREIQELGTLGDTEAAALLFNISIGLDRVSLVDTMRELDASRRRLLGDGGRPCQIVQLIEQRDRLRAELEELGSLTTQYARLVGQRDFIEREAARLEDDKTQLQRDVRTVEIAVAVRDRWRRRAELDQQLAAMNLAGAMPEGTLARLDRLQAQLERRRRQIAQIVKRRRRIRAEGGRLRPNETLWRQAPRIAAFGEQESWIATLDSRTAELETEIRDTQSQLDAQRERLGLDGAAARAIDFTSLAPRSLGKVRSAGRAAAAARRSLDDARAEADSARSAAEQCREELATALASRGESDLTTAIDHAGSLVTQLRRRVQLDERIDQMGRYHADLESQSRRCLERQILPLGLVVFLGLMFVFGVVLLAAGLVTSSSITGGFGWLLAILGAIGAGVALGAKTLIERSNANKLDACEKQLHMLQLQLQQAGEERESLDRTLGGAGVSARQRLAEAQETLAELEALMPLETRRQTAVQEADAARARAERLHDEFTSSRRRWRESLAAAGLPEQLAPKQLRQLLRHRDALAHAERHLARCNEELQQRQNERNSLAERITALAAEAGVAVGGEGPIALVRQLNEELRRQEGRIAQRDRLRLQWRTLGRRRAKIENAARRLKRRRRDLLNQIGVDDEDELRSRSEEYARAEQLRRQRDAIAVEIDAARGAHCSDEALARVLADDESDLESRWEELDRRLRAAESQWKECLEKRGQLGAELAALATDRRAAVKQMELATVEHRLGKAIDRWRVLSLACRTLQTIKTIYEKDRQPETLQEASGYMRRLTNGRYTRVWSPLGEDILHVDDAQGQSLPVKSLSRGTREQLFLSLRLALVGTYARRGAALPLVLDDVLVNFDAPRAKAAAEVLRDFARAGHQLLVFTCHDHILHLFQSLKVHARRLPSRTEAVAESAAPVESPERKKSKSSKKPKRKSKRKREPEPTIEQDEDETADVDLDPAPWEDAIDDEAPPDDELDNEDDDSEDDRSIDSEDPELEEDDCEFEWIDDDDENEDDDSAEAA